MRVARDLTQYVWKMARDIAGFSQSAYMENIHRRMYLWHRPTNSCADGQCIVSEERPGACWELSTNEAIPRNLTNEQVTTWAHNVLRRLPILPA